MAAAHSQGKLPRDVGMDPLTTLFMRSDTPSGINTAAWSAPQQYWGLLSEAIGKGYIKPTERGWQALGAKGISPQAVGGAATKPPGAGGVGPGGEYRASSGAQPGAGGQGGRHGRRRQHGGAERPGQHRRIAGRRPGRPAGVPGVDDPLRG